MQKLIYILKQFFNVDRTKSFNEYVEEEKKHTIVIEFKSYREDGAWVEEI